MKALTNIITIIFISCSLFLSPTTQAQETEKPPFNDVESGQEHFVAINYLKKTNSISGYKNGDFQPYKKINRAEALTMIMQAFQPENNNANKLTNKGIKETNFIDVPKDAWFYPSVKYAVNHSIISGYDNKTFKPDQSITLGEALAITLRTLNKPVPTNTIKAPFSDVPTNAWHSPYFAYAKEKEIISIYRGNKVHPNETINRGEMAELIYRMLQSSLGAKYGSASYYSDIFEGKGTASGEKFSQHKLTAAHLTLPFGTKLRITNLYNGKSIEVKVNDRGPYGHPGRKIDLSRKAFEAIGRTSRGFIYIEYKIIDQ